MDGELWKGQRPIQIRATAIPGRRKIFEIESSVMRLPELLITSVTENVMDLKLKGKARWEYCWFYSGMCGSTP
jgi:hypothetical protein